MKRKLLVVLSLFFLYHYSGVGTEPLPVLVEGGEPFEKRSDFYISSNSPMENLLISSNGKIIISASAKSIQIWDVETGKELRNLEEYIGSFLKYVAISSNGKKLAFTSLNSTAKILDIKTGKVLKNFEEYKKNVSSIAIDSNGKVLFLGLSNGNIKVWDIEKMKELKSLNAHNEKITSLEISSSGKILVSGSANGNIKIWNIKTNKEIKHLIGDKSSIDFIKITISDKRILTRFRNRTNVIWDIETGQKLKDFVDDKSIDQLYITPSGQNFVVNTKDKVNIWGLSMGKKVQSVNRETMKRISLNNRVVVSSQNIIQLMHISTGTLLRSFGGQLGYAQSIEISHNNEILVSGVDDKIKIWDIAKEKILRSLEGHNGTINSIAISPNGKMIVSGSSDNTIKIWDIETGKELKSLKNHKKEVSSIAISPDGKMIVSGSEDNTIKIWDIETGKELKSLEAHKEEVTSVVISSNGKMIVSCSRDMSIIIWDIERGKEFKHLKLLEGSTINSVDISPNGKIVVAGLAREAIIWNIENGEKLKTLGSHMDWISSVAINQDGKTFISSSYDHDIKVWDIKTGKELKHLEGHIFPITSIAISPNAKNIISASVDGTIKEWDIETGEWRKEYISGSKGTWAIFVKDPKGNYFNRGDDGTFLMKKEGTIVTPVAPKDIAKKDNLEIESTELSLRSDETLPFDLTLENKEHNSYWIKANGNDGHCAIGQNVLTKLEKGKKGKLTLDLTCTLPRVNPKPIAKHEFNLTLVTANESEFNVTVPVSISFADINVTKAEVSEDGKNLNIEVKNIGDEKLVNAKVKLSKPFNADVVALTNFEKNTSKVLAFAIPKDVNLTDDDLVSLNLYIPNEENKNALPLYEWQHKSVPIILNKLTWYIYALWVLIAIVFLAMILYYKRYKNPMVIKLSKNPTELLTLSPSQLKEAKKRLETIKQWESTIQLAGVNVETVHNTLAFYANPTVKSFAEYFNIKHYEEVGEFYKVHLPNLGLNVDNFLLYLAKEDAEKVKEKCPREDKIFVISTEEHQDEIAKLAHNKTNNIIAPTTVELSKLLLSKDIKRNLAQILAKCLSFKYLSPYQTKGGLMEESNFFGRTEIIKEMLTKERVNYLLVGARQLGKTSILKALEREYENSSTVECYYFSLEYSNILFELNQALRLSKENSLEEVVEAIRAKKKKVVFLIDEADKFIDKEESDKISSVFRKLAQENHAVFVLAGFWKLYYSATMDYQSPLKNFGEVIHLGELESEACHELMIKPMQRIGVGYENEKVVKQLIENCGNRANLIAMVCADLLKELDGNVIEQKDIDRGLESKNVSLALNEWEALTKDEEANRINRLIVYLTFKDEKFSITEVLERIEQSELEISVEKIETSLKQLVLGFVFKEHRGVYEYRVPLVKKRLLEDEYRLEVTLKRIVRGLKGDKNRKA